MALFKNSRKKSIALIAAAGVTVAGTGVAFAYWTSTGEGEGTATTGESMAFTIVSTAAVGGPLTPGGATQAVGFTVTNPSTGVQTLSGIDVSVANDDGSEWDLVVGCSDADYTVSITTAPTYGEIMPGGSVTGTATVTMVNSATNQDGCQNAVVPLYFQADAPA